MLILAAYVSKLESLHGDAIVKPVALLGVVFALYLIDREPGPLLEVLVLCLSSAFQQA